MKKLNCDTPQNQTKLKELAVRSGKYHPKKSGGIGI